MDADEVAKRIEAVAKRAATAGRLDWYERNAPLWWGHLKELLDDGIWASEDLERYCRKWFRRGAVETRNFFGLGKTELEKIEREIPERVKVLEGLNEKAREEIKLKKKEQKKAMTQAERARAYRERKKAGNPLGERAKRAQ